MERHEKDQIISELKQLFQDYSSFYLTDTTALNDAKIPARIIREFRKNGKIPALKAAWAEQTVFIGDNQLAELEKIKNKNELIGDVIGLLQSPAKSVISGLQSGGNKLSGILKTLEERAA